MKHDKESFKSKAVNIYETEKRTDALHYRAG